MAVFLCPEGGAIYFEVILDHIGVCPQCGLGMETALKMQKKGLCLDRYIETLKKIWFLLTILLCGLSYYIEKDVEGSTKRRKR